MIATLFMGRINLQAMPNAQEDYTDIDPAIAAMINTMIDQIAVPKNIADYACDKNWEKVKELAVKPSINVNAITNNSWTALMKAARHNNLEIVQFLLNNGADVNAKSNYGWTALILATIYNNLEIVQLLLNKGADVSAKNKDGRTALILASTEGHLDIIQLLVSHGADLTIKDNQGFTALMHAQNYAEKYNYDKIKKHLTLFKYWDVIIFLRYGATAYNALKWGSIITTELTITRIWKPPFFLWLPAAFLAALSLGRINKKNIIYSH